MGQGTVYKAHSPERSRRITDCLGQILDEFRRLKSQLQELGSPGPQQVVRELTKLFLDAGSPDEIKDLGALKIFKMPEDPEEHARAFGRLEKEIVALKKVRHPAVLNLLHAQRDQHFMITEFHPSGTLDQHLHRFKGRVLDTLLAFRPLVEAVSILHKHDVIHRDIKPNNIFVASDGHLVLGDFGIVFFRDAKGDRWTETYERVGSRDWMAQWANNHRRIEEVNPTLDITLSAKFLWCMISGQHSASAICTLIAQRTIGHLFLGGFTTSMRSVNKILERCVVEDEEHCMKAGDELLGLVDQTIAHLRSLGLRPEGRHAVVLSSMREGTLL